MRGLIFGILRYLLHISETNMSMVLLGKGHCKDGFYKGWKGLRDIQACNDLCLVEKECLYASFCDECLTGATSKCSGYNSDNCVLTTSQYTQSKSYITYKKGMSYS